MKVALNLFSGFRPLSLLNFLQCKFRTIFWMTGTVIGKREQTPWRGLLEGFSQVVSEASRNFILDIFFLPTKRQPKVMRPSALIQEDHNKKNFHLSIIFHSPFKDDL
jgi:hypothetical protein